MKRAAAILFVVSLAAAAASAAVPAEGGDRTRTFSVGKGGTLDVRILGGTSA